MQVRYYDELLAFLVRAVRDPHEAQDLAQQAFERVLQHQRAGHRVDDLRALLYEVARNLLVDRHRRLQVRQHDSDAVLLDHPGPSAGEPDTVYAGRQRLQVLIAAIESLPPRCRRAFILHKIDGLSHAEVAAQMEISLNMVERHIMLAVAACRKALGDAPVRKALHAAAHDAQ
ncbi:sigma-70 family RNA polymerase sigma factor [Pseudorhodoferax sp. LjRoot39]|uniref:RNA polymerase sigma factor n=1 Tax=Pseudorhodoferax sp. LjRoot39 TaxID=3342328 RepID=UPI003ED0D45B